MSSNYSEDIKLNVTRFGSQLSGSIPSLQTKTKVLHFPYKVNQPQIQFECIFRNETDYELFQDFVRKHHLAAIGSGNDISSVSLWWPERGINNWTGYIRGMLAGGEKNNPAPIASFSIELVDSFISRRTTLSSFGSPFQAIFGQQINYLRRDWWREPKAVTPPPPPLIGDSGSLPGATLPQPAGAPFIGDAGSG